MLMEKAPTFIVRAKTGWATRLKPQIRWYLGYVESSNDVWFFATNLEISNEKGLPLRQKLTRRILQEKGDVITGYEAHRLPYSGRGELLIMP